MRVKKIIASNFYLVKREIREVISSKHGCCHPEFISGYLTFKEMLKQVQHDTFVFSRDYCRKLGKMKNTFIFLAFAGKETSQQQIPKPQYLPAFPK